MKRFSFFGVLGTISLFFACSEENTDASVNDIATEDVIFDVITDAEGIPDTGYLPPRGFYKVDNHAVVLKDEPYLEERVEFYYKPEQLPELEAERFAFSNGLYLIAKGRLLKYREDTNRFEDISPSPSPILNIGKTRDCDYLIYSTSDEIVLFGDNKEKKISIASLPKPIVALTGFNNNYYFATEDAVYRVNNNLDGFEKILDIPSIRDLIVDKNLHIFAATDGGLYEHDGTTLKRYTAEGNEIGDNLTSSLSLCNDGTTIIVGSYSGFTIYTENRFERFFAKVDGLPMNRTTSVYCEGNMIALGHEIGATFIDTKENHIDYYLSRRWILDEKVNDVIVDDKGNRFIATKNGVSRIYLEETTLADKIKYFEEIQDRYFWRMDGFVAPNLSSSDEFEIKDPVVWDSDNDGLWTQMQIAAWCMAYAVTKDEYYYRKARKAIEVMFLEVDIPAVDFQKAGLGYGFVTRSLVREDEGDVYTSKASQSNWHPVEYNGRRYYWKDDTSSDEIDGHFFGYSFYYDHCAKNEEEREEVARRLGGIADYILRNGYQLLDLDGEKTTWGHWQPDYIGVSVNGMERCLSKYSLELCMESAHGGGWLNGTQILGFMLSAYRITGDIKFYNAYEELITKYKYDKLIEFTDDVWTVTRPAIANHSDHELAMLAYTILLRYEHNPERRARWLSNLLKFYEWEIPERQPMWAAVVALYSEDKARVEDAIRTMREIPRDLRKMLVDNSNRQDANDNGLDRHKHPQWDRVFPYDEIRKMWWNGNPYSKADGRSPKNYGGPMFYSIAYWMLRYAGVLE